MAKRYTDTNKYKEAFMKSLPGPYKLLWDYINHDCNHAGIWIVDFEVAQIYIGKEMMVNKRQALILFNTEKEKRIFEFDRGKRWLINSFLTEQYGILNPKNKVHNSVLEILDSFNLNTEIKYLTSTSYGAKDIDKEKEKEKLNLNNKKNPKKITPDLFTRFWKLYPRKVAKPTAQTKWNTICKKADAPDWDIIKGAILEQKETDQWGRGIIPHPTTWLNQQRWDDDVSFMNDIRRKTNDKKTGRKITTDFGQPDKEK
jgi:hypothetical protein